MTPSKLRRDEAGFTLIDLLFVVALIGTICTIALPTLLRARTSAQAASAIADMRVVNSAQLSYAITCGSGFYAPDLPTLGLIPLGSRVPFLAGSDRRTGRPEERLPHSDDGFERRRRTCGLQRPPGGAGRSSVQGWRGSNRSREPDPAALRDQRHGSHHGRRCQPVCGHARSWTAGRRHAHPVAVVLPRFLRYRNPRLRA